MASLATGSLMARTRGTLSKYAKKQEEEATKERAFQVASKALTTGKKFKSMVEAARFFEVPYHTFCQ